MRAQKTIDDSIEERKKKRRFDRSTKERSNDTVCAQKTRRRLSQQRIRVALPNIRLETCARCDESCADAEFYPLSINSIFNIDHRLKIPGSTD